MAAPHRRAGFTIDPISYSYRETDGSVWRDRVGGTSLLFGIAMVLSYLLGRPHRQPGNRVSPSCRASARGRDDPLISRR